jgi:serine/threonine protein kinase/dipeptidyl aminopeptidase/acylaminoacyl peptidase
MTSRTLQPEDQISHYRIVGPLGAGGMGEVYLAQDQTLERSVALKILPPELVRNEERVRRFQREAKSASSLNHPNIVTIYEIGQDEVRGHEGDGPKEPGSSSVHYISMELVSGATLTTKIHQDKTDLRTLLGYLAQAAEGLAKAHAAGIVHRDLKPGNIMVSKDGFAKILDFGLAKLTEKQSSDPDVTSGLSDGGEGTSVGAIVGTVAYMSPEQVRGSSVDQRSDIFSFGSILYEATTRKKPFVADSNVETMHKILHDKPAPVEELNKEAPAELRRLIRRCLAKNPEQRLQSAKDLAIELREIVDEYEELSASAGSGSGSSALGAAPPARRRYSRTSLLVGGLIIAGALIAGAFIMRQSNHGGERTSATPLKISTVTSRGAANGCALSSDGRYLAYSIGLGGQGTLWMRQVATGSDVQILPPQKTVPTGLTFTPDGNYLYYLSGDPDREGYTALFEVATLGGTPRKRAYDVDSRVTFSPDGKRMCFFRGVPQNNEERLIVFDLDTSKERILASAIAPLSLRQPAWSPDGKRIAAIESDGSKAPASSIVTFGVDDGRRQPLGKGAWAFAGDLVWLGDGSGLVISAFDQSTIAVGQLWKVTYPDGRIHRITSDQNLYGNLSVSADGATIAAVRVKQEANLWLAEPGGTRKVRQITFGSGDEGAVQGFDVTQDSTVLFSMIKDGSAQIWAAGPGGDSPKQVTSGPRSAFAPVFRPGAGLFYHMVDSSFAVHIWRADANGENARQLTFGKGEQFRDVSPDGGTVLFQRGDHPDVMLSVSSDGGEPVSLGASTRTSGLFSPDGSRILHAFIHEVNGQGTFTPQVIPAKGGGSVLNPALPPRGVDPAWTPDGKGLTYLHGSNGQRNLFRLQLDGVKPEEITRFTDGRITQHRWSPDGKRLLLQRRMDNADNLWVVNADGSNPVAITDFETGDIADMKWTRDGSRVVFTYGEASQNVVLVRNFK